MRTETDRAVVCVQGLGFVGTAMAVATASALRPDGEPWFDVIGVDLPTPAGASRVDAINAGEMKLASTDPELQRSLARCRAWGNICATSDEKVFQKADIVLVDIHLDVDFSDTDKPSVDFTGFRAAIATLGRHLRPGALVIVETTVPPGTCELVVAPELAAQLRKRGLDEGSVLLAHSYERVMPGSDYLNSIVNFWRVYSGATNAAADACEQFLQKVINVREFPLTRLHSTRASETAKILENSYRAANIAFIHEWGVFAERAGINLFEVLGAIRMRPTHNNIRQPGFGVGGYCLTKDPAFAIVSAEQLLRLPQAQFPFSTMAMHTNSAMPLHSVERLSEACGGDLKGRRVLVLGVSYRQDVGDTRYSPTEIFVRAVEELGAVVTAHDPLVRVWPELDRELPETLPDPRDFDAVVFTVAHREYLDLDVVAWLNGSRPVMVDTNQVLRNPQIASLRSHGHNLAFVGRGD